MGSGIYEVGSCPGDKLILIDRPGQFLLKIGEKKIPRITGYTITSDAKNHGLVELTLRICIPKNEITVESDCKLK